MTEGSIVTTVRVLATDGRWWWAWVCLIGFTAAGCLNFMGLAAAGCVASFLLFCALAGGVGWKYAKTGCRSDLGSIEVMTAAAFFNGLANWRPPQEFFAFLGALLIAGALAAVAGFQIAIRRRIK